MTLFKILVRTSTFGSREMLRSDDGGLINKPFKSYDKELLSSPVKLKKKGVFKINVKNGIFPQKKRCIVRLERSIDKTPVITYDTSKPLEVEALI